MKFKLLDETDNYKEYSFEVDLSYDEFDDWADGDPDFDDFMEKMECSDASYAGVHDATGGVDEDGSEWIGYNSYEIEDFPLALSMWKEFFKTKNLIN